MKSKTIYQTREQRIEVIKRQLLQDHMPRIQMSLILLFTGLAGFLASFLLLQLDVTRMWLRYPIAILIAYGVFLLLLRLWLWIYGREMDVDLDLDDIDLELPAGESGSSEVSHFNSGVDIGDSHAGGNWEESVASSAGSSSGSSSSGIGFDLDLEELGILIIVLIVLVCALLASLYVIYIAPLLLAEILIDGVLLVGLYKRVKHIEQRHWLRAAVRRTLIPALITATLFSVAGFVMQTAVPAAHSIGGFWKNILN